MKRKRPILPEYPASAPLFRAAQHALDMAEDVENICFEDETLEGLEGIALNFSGCTFRSVTFGENDIEHMSFADCVLDHCDFSGFKLLEGSMHRVEITGCRGMGAQMDRSVLSNVLVKDCRVGYMTISECKLTNVEFCSSELENMLLYSCQMKDSAFESCRMLNAEITGTSLKGIDLTTDDISGLRAQLDCLKGAKISVLQTPMMCALLGMKVE